MATAGSFAARIKEIATSTTLGGAYTDVEKIQNARLRVTTKTADTSNNDDGGWESDVVTWLSWELTFDMIADEAATGQEALWASALAGTQLFYRLRPRGDNSGDRQVRGQGSISIEYAGQSTEGAKYAVTVKGTGAPTRDTQ